MTQGICGRTYFDCPEPDGPLSSWASRLQERLATLGSTESALIWKAKTTPAGRSIFRLAPSTRLTNGTGCIGALWITVSATDSAARENRYAQGGNPLTMQMALAYMPTPTVADVTGGRKSRSGSRSGEPLLNGIMAGYHAAPLASDVRKHSENPETVLRRISKRQQVALNAAMALDASLDGETAHGGPAPTGSPATTTRRVGSPTPAHPCWLQGFEAAWLYLAPENSARPRTRKKSAG